MDIPRIFTISESAHRIHNPFTPENLATLGAALHLESGSALDLGCGSGEMLCTWARDYGIIGVGIDMSLVVHRGRRNSALKNWSHRLASSSSTATLWATSPKKRSVWQPVSVPRGSGGGVAGTIQLQVKILVLEQFTISSGEPYWLRLPPTEDVARGCVANAISDFLMLPGTSRVF